MQFKGITPLVLKNELDKYGIEARLLWKPLHMQPVFKDAVFISENNDDQMSNAEYLFSTGLCLPSATQMTEAEQNYVIEICMMLFKQLTDNK